MLGGMSGGGMGFIVAPEKKQQAQTELQLIMDETKRELESAGYLQGARDELDDLLTWTLTDKGRHKARQLG